jgi:phosphoketolase
MNELSKMADGVDGGQMKRAILITALFWGIGGGLFSKEEGTITTPFDMTMQNDLDRFQLVADAVDGLPRPAKGHRPEAAAQGQAHRIQAVHREAWPRLAGNPELTME